MDEENKFIQAVINSVYGKLPVAREYDDVTVLEEVPYAIRLGFRNLNLNYYTAKDKNENKRPLIIWIHGGAFMFGSRRFPPPFLTVDNTFHKMVRHGFDVATIDYRFSGEALWPAQLDDAISAITWLQNRADELGFDEKQIALWGESAGAHIAAATGIRFNAENRFGRNQNELHKIAAVVDWYGPTDFAKMDSQAPNDFAGQPHDDSASPESRLLGAPIQSVPDRTFDANPANFVTADSPAFHIRHGENDHLVAVGQSELLADALTKAGVLVDFVKIPGADHGFEGYSEAPLLVDEGISFLKRLY